MADTPTPEAAAANDAALPQPTLRAFVPAPETVALIRRLYEAGVTIKKIVAASGVTNLDILYGCVGGRYPDGTSEHPAPLRKRRPGAQVRHRPGSRTALVERMWRTAEQQVRHVEERLQAAGLQLVERESSARTLAVIAKTLRELSAVDEAQKSRKRKNAANNDIDDESRPRNVEDLRQALAQKLEAFIAQRGDAVCQDAE